jgi:biofilm protein TabA
MVSEQPPCGRPLPDPSRFRFATAQPDMILDSLTVAAQYERLDPGIALGLAYLRNFDPDTPDGRYALDDDDLFAMVQSYDTAPATESRFEAHRKYLDIQYVAAGSERILHLPTELVEVETPYSDAGDVVFFKEPGVSSSLLLRPGQFAVLYPTDAHKPGCMAGGRERVKKVVVKVRM